MTGVVTEKKYPIRKIWLFKGMLFELLLLPIALFVVMAGAILLFDVDNYEEQLFTSKTLIDILQIVGLFIILTGIPVIINALRRSNFHYALEEDFIVLHQGVISKQNRNVPYGRIQGVFIHQRISDRIFGLASLTLEDFSHGGKSAMNVDGYVGLGEGRYEAIGCMGNKIHIPGLKKGDAEKLKAVILQKVRERQIEDNQSGL